MKRSEIKTFEDFSKLVQRLHQLINMEFLISYIDPRDNDLLPINNDDNFGRAMSTAKPLLRVIVQRKGIIRSSQFNKTMNFKLISMCVYSLFLTYEYHRRQSRRIYWLWNNETTKYNQ